MLWIDNHSHTPISIDWPRKVGSLQASWWLHRSALLAVYAVNWLLSEESWDAQACLFPSSTKGLNPSEHTIADHLKLQGYATACFGKWHLGHHPEVLPTSNGFDTYFGIPYSNDMNHPDNKGKPQGGPQGMDILWNDPESTLTKWKTPLFEDEAIVELPVDQRTVTRRYTQKAIDFVTAHQDEPFFVYLPHSMPHIPLYVPDDVRDPNPRTPTQTPSNTLIRRSGVYSTLWIVEASRQHVRHLHHRQRSVAYL